MAIINCKECKKEVSDQAKICPNCGFDIQKEKTIKTTGKGCVYIILGITAFVFLISVIDLFSKKSDTNEPLLIDTLATTNINNQLDSVAAKKELDSINKIYEIEVAKFKKTKAGKIQTKHPDWSKEDCELIANKKIWIGMHYDMLIYLRGKPNTINTSNYGNGNEYQCCWDDYDISCVYMKEDHIITSYN